MRKQSLFLICGWFVSSAVALADTTPSHFAGGDIGNGGNQLARAFRNYAKEGIAALKKARCAGGWQMDWEKLEAKVNSSTTEIYSTSEQLYAVHPQTGKERPADAINLFPKEDTIFFNLFAWAAMNDSDRRVLATHEFLGLAGVEESFEFRYSSMIEKGTLTPLHFELSVPGKANDSLMGWDARMGWSYLNKQIQAFESSPLVYDAGTKRWTSHWDIEVEDSRLDQVIFAVRAHIKESAWKLVVTSKTYGVLYSGEAGQTLEWLSLVGTLNQLPVCAN